MVLYGISVLPFQLSQLPGIVQRANKAGVHGVRQLPKAEIHTLEPELSPDVLGGIWIPGEASVDSWLAPVMMAHRARRAGAQVI